MLGILLALLVLLRLYQVDRCRALYSVRGMWTEWIRTSTKEMSGACGENKPNIEGQRLTVVEEGDGT